MDQAPYDSEHFHLAHSFFERGESSERVRRELDERGLPQEEAERILSAAKSAYYGKRRHRGTILILIGSVCLVFGFLLMMALGGGTAFNYVMYGVTTAGAITLLAGLVDVLGF